MKINEVIINSKKNKVAEEMSSLLDSIFNNPCRYNNVNPGQRFIKNDAVPGKGESEQRGPSPRSGKSKGSR